MSIEIVDVSNVCCAPLRKTVLEHDDAEALAKAFKALADPVRLQLLNMIATAEDGGVCACDLVETLDRSQPTISHHLKVLRDAGLVTSERRGTWIWYSVDPERVDALQRALARR